MTSARLANLLETAAGRPVVDQTRLAGEFDVDLTWSPDLSIFTAIREQLGLRLEPGASIVQDSIVIDRVDRPTAN